MFACERSIMGKPFDWWRCIFEAFCGPCHSLYPHFNMSLVHLPDGGKGVGVPEY